VSIQSISLCSFLCEPIHVGILRCFRRGYLLQHRRCKHNDAGSCFQYRKIM